MGLAEVVILFIVAAACYAGLAPLRRRIERAWLRRGHGRRGPADVISLTRGGDGVYVAHQRKDVKHGDER